MPEFAVRLALLLMPVAALLFAGLLRRQRLRYPHTLFLGRDGRTAGMLLFRRLRLFYDAAIDALIALVIAAALGGWPGPRELPAAFVVDWSRSMAEGFPGSRPVDLAIRSLRADPRAEGASWFLLRQDPLSGEAVVEDATAAIAGGGDPASLVAVLRATRPMLGADPSALAALSRKARRDIVLASDSAAYEAVGFELLAMPSSPVRAALPARVSRDHEAGGWTAFLAARGGARELLVLEPGPEGAAPRALGPERAAVEAVDGGWKVRLSAPGAYLAMAEDATLPFVATEGPGRPSGHGSFSAAMAGVFEFLPDLGGRGAVFTDSPQGDGARGPAPVGGVDGARIVASAIATDAETAVRLADPASTRGRLLALGAPGAGPPEADFVLAPRALENPNLPLAYWTVLEREAARIDGAFEALKIVSAGDGLFAYGSDGRVRAAAPPAAEYEEVTPGPRVVLPSPEARRWIPASLLALLALAKLALARAFARPGRKGGP